MQTALPVPSPARLSIQHLFALILAAVVFTPLLALAFYTGPSADDFCTAILMRDLGFVATQVKFYLSWSGRYATSAIVGLLTGHSAWITAYSLVPIALIFLTFASITFLIRSAFVFLKAPSPAHNTLALGVVATAMTFGLTPSLAEMIYWTSGALTYQLSFIVTMLTCSLTLLMLSRDTRAGTVALAMLVAAANVLLIGLNEIAMLITLLLSMLLVVAGVTQKRHLKLFLALLCVTIFGALVAMLSPGNAARASSHSAKMELSSALEAGYHYILFTMLDVIFSENFWLLTIIFILLLPRHALRKIHIGWIWSIALLTIAIVSVGIVMPLFAGGYLPSRVTSLLTEIFLLGALSVVTLVVFRAVRHAALIEGVTALRPLWVLIYSLAIGTLIFSPNSINRAYAELLDGSASTYDHELKLRYAQIAAARGINRELVEVDAFSRRPRTIFFDDIQANEKDWRNVCYADYFRIARIRLKSSP